MPSNLSQAADPQSPTPAPRSSRGYQATLVFVLFFLLFLVVVSRYIQYLSDDALISLRYAQRLLEGKGLTWTDGRPVEGYSNLLWVLLVAGVGAFGVELIQAARLLGIACVAVIIGVILRLYVFSDRLHSTWLPISAGLLFLVMAGPVAVWTIGGLEQPLFAALLALSIFFALKLLDGGRLETRNLLLLSLALGLMCITRPDGPIFVVATGVALLFGRRDLGRKLWLLLLFPLLLYGGHLIFRVAYYGEWVPNSALVKLEPSAAHAADGLAYVLGGGMALFPFSMLTIISLAVLCLNRQKRAVGVYLALTAGLWGLYLIVIGGDVFAAYRHFMPLAVIFTFAIIEGVDTMLEWLRKREKASAPRVALVSVLLVVAYGINQYLDAGNRWAISEHWVWSCQDLAVFLKEAFQEEQPVVAMTTAGCIPYWTDFPGIDMLGLNDYYIAHHPPSDTGSGFIGHELGDSEYILGREPDIILFHVGSETPRGLPGLLSLPETARFREQYAPVRLQLASGLEATIWVRKSSPRVGMRERANGFVIPGYLLKSGDGYLPLIQREDGGPRVQLEGGEMAYVETGLGLDQQESLSVSSIEAKSMEACVEPGDDGTTRLLLRAREKLAFESIMLHRGPAGPGSGSVAVERCP